MAASVTLGPGHIIGQEDRNGTVWFHWSFSATVDGRVGIFDFWLDINDFTQASEFAQVSLEENPDLLGGIA
jgi:hypothetical protein